MRHSDLTASARVVLTLTPPIFNLQSKTPSATTPTTCTSISTFIIASYLLPPSLDYPASSLTRFNQIVRAEMAAITSRPMPSTDDWVFVPDNTHIFGAGGSKASTVEVRPASTHPFTSRLRPNSPCALPYLALAAGEPRHEVASSCAGRPRRSARCGRSSSILLAGRHGRSTGLPTFAPLCWRSAAMIVSSALTANTRTVLRFLSNRCTCSFLSFIPSWGLLNTPPLQHAHTGTRPLPHSLSSPSRRLSLVSALRTLNAPSAFALRIRSQSSIRHSQ